MRRGEERALARGIEYAGSKIRKVFPDFDDGAEIVGITDSDRGVVRLSTGDEITMPFSPRGASAVGLGAKGRIQFVRRGNKQFPLWRTCCEGNGRAPVVAAYPWPTFRANFARQNCIPGTYTPGTPTLGPAASAITRSTEETIWDYRGNPEEQYPELPMTLYRDGESVDLTGFVIFDLSLVGDDLLALAEDDAEFWAEGLDGAGWDDDTVQKQALRRIAPDGETLWAYYAPVRSFPEYDPGGDDDDGGAS